MVRISVEFARVVNCNSLENRSNTPDHVLGEFLQDCLAAFDRATNSREKWYGRGQDNPAPSLDGVRPEVAAFAVLMERKLRENDHKPGWKKEDPRTLIARIKEEVTELHRAYYIPPFDRLNVFDEAKDVANFCMMLVDCMGGLGIEPEPEPEDPSDEVVEKLASFCDLSEDGLGPGFWVDKELWDRVRGTRNEALQEVKRLRSERDELLARQEAYADENDRLVDVIREGLGRRAFHGVAHGIDELIKDLSTMRARVKELEQEVDDEKEALEQATRAYMELKGARNGL